MDDRHQPSRRLLEEAVLRSPAHLDPGVREAIAERRDVPEDLRALVEKVRHQAYRVTDQDFAPLRARYSEDELFEVVVAAALGAALARVRAGLKSLEEA
jgi:alkylhydroperoxidase family enzyme